MVIVSHLYFLAIPSVVLSSRYDYGLFENFEIMKDAFVQEKTATLRLEKIRMQIHNGMKKISHYNFLNFHECFDARAQYFDTTHDNRKWSSFRLKRTFCNPMSRNLQFLYIHNKRRHNGYLDPPNYNYSMSTQEIMEGAQKGLIMLQETYDLNVREFAKGTIQKDVASTSRKIDSLYPDDLASMSTIALNMFRWYDNSLQYLKASLEGFHNLSETQKEEFLPTNFKEKILMMRSSYSVAHNEMLYKKRKHIGSDWKLFPYLVDKGVLKAFKGNNKYLGSSNSTNISFIF